MLHRRVPIRAAFCNAEALMGASRLRIRGVSAEHQSLRHKSVVFVWLPRHPRRTNGRGTPIRWMRSKIATDESRGTATSAT